MGEAHHSRLPMPPHTCPRRPMPPHAVSRRLTPSLAVSRPIATTVDVSTLSDALIHPLTADGCRRVPIVVQGSTGLKIGLAAPRRKPAVIDRAQKSPTTMR
jgi:hypothetical protein